MEKALGDLASQIYIDVHVQHHSLERALVFAFHPLSSLQHPSSYHWDPSLLSLLLTRHRVACVLVAQQLSISRPWYARGLYEEHSVTSKGYQAYRSLHTQIQNRTYTDLRITSSREPKVSIGYKTQLATTPIQR